MRVTLENLDNDNNTIFNVTLDMSVTYSEVLVARLNKLQAFTNLNTLGQATSLINEAGVTCTEAEVDKVLFGAKGLIPSTLASLEGNNTNRPPNYTGTLTRLEGSPHYVDQYGREYVRGAIVEGSYPYKTPTNTFTAIRNCIEQNLNLPRYIRHQLGKGDHTFARDAQGKSV